MTLTHILIFSGLGLLVWALACSPRPVGWGQGARGWALLVLSALALFWLQPAMPLRWMDFWLPLGTLALAVAGWAGTRAGADAPSPALSPKRGHFWGREIALPPFLFSKMGGAGGGRVVLGENALTAVALAGVALLVGLSRYLPFDALLTASRPPQAGAVALGVLAAAGLALVMLRLPRRASTRGLIALLLALFVVIKTPGLAALAAAGLRGLAGQSVTLAASSDLRWLGFSYLAFRLIHTARDRQSGRLPEVTLREYVTYAVFFPALTAGPIDRLERFIKDLRAPNPQSLGWGGLLAAGERLVVGLVKKFVLADALAMIALNGQNAAQVQGAGWAWLLAAAYSLLIYFDFSGYTDIAIGIGLLLGVKLPENFNAPYAKPNLTQFWNNWHMTLTQWFRAYYFNPVTRWLRAPTQPSLTRGGGQGRGLSAPVVIFATQVSTMVLIGLWHGVTWNFVIWGLWHGLGLFAHNRWSDFARGRFSTEGAWARVQPWVGAAATFVFVTLGWVFFALPTPGLALRLLGVMFGK